MYMPSGRCRKGVDPLSYGSSKFIAIDEQPNDQIVHVLRFGKTDGAAHQPFDPGPQIDVFALDFLRVLLAHPMLVGVDVPLVSSREQGDAGDYGSPPVQWLGLFTCHSNPEKLLHACQTSARLMQR